MLNIFKKLYSFQVSAFLDIIPLCKKILFSRFRMALCTRKNAYNTDDARQMIEQIQIITGEY